MLNYALKYSTYAQIANRDNNNYTATPSGLVTSFPSLSQHGTLAPDANFSTLSAVLHLSENWVPICHNFGIKSGGSGGIFFASLRSYEIVSNGEYKKEGKCTLRASNTQVVQRHSGRSSTYFGTSTFLTISSIVFSSPSASIGPTNIRAMSFNLNKVPLAVVASFSTRNSHETRPFPVSSATGTLTT